MTTLFARIRLALSTKDAKEKPKKRVKRCIFGNFIAIHIYKYIDYLPQIAYVTDEHVQGES